MLYRVLLDGDDILDYSDPEMVLLSPQVQVELDTAGSFEFTVPPNHKYYTRFSMDSVMGMTIEVYEDTVLHFFGRPVELHLDFYKNKKVYCEGAMSYFNDSIQRKKEYDEGTTLSSFFQDVISRHNEMVEEKRQFTIDRMTVPDHSVYRSIDDEQTADVLKSKLLDAEEAHYFLERNNGTNYISLLKDDTMPYECNQVVKFAENLLNLTYSFDGKDFATCVIPIGGTIREEDGGTGEPITIASVNGGSDILVGNAAAKFGRITRVEKYSDIKDASALLAEGKKYLTRLQYNATLIECSAVDLHSKDDTKTPFRVGQMVHCISQPHGIELDLPLSKLTLQLDSAAKQITLGRIPKKTLSRFYKEEGIGGIGVGGVTGINPDDVDTQGWLPIPGDDMDPVLTKKVPIMIQIIELPYETEWADGETISYAGIVVKAVAKGLPDIEYFDDPIYCPNGVIPFADLEFPTTVMPTNPSSSTVKVWVRWKNPYTGKYHQAPFYLTNSTKKAQEQAAIAAHGSAYPEYIEVTHVPGKTTYTDGQYIDFEGLQVTAYYPDGSPYDQDGYHNGIIPITELEFPSRLASLDQCSSVDVSTTDPLVGNTQLYGTVTGVTGTNFGPVEKEGYDIRIETTGGLFTFTGSTIIFASTDPNASCWTRSDAGHNGAGHTISSFSVNGKTVYYASFADHWHRALKPYFGDVIPESDITPATAYAAIAWSMFYGSVTKEGTQSIPVQWSRPGDGETLETAFAIDVEASGRKSNPGHASGTFVGG